MCIILEITKIKFSQKTSLIKIEGCATHIINVKNIYSQYLNEIWLQPQFHVAFDEKLICQYMETKVQKKKTIQSEIYKLKKQKNYHRFVVVKSLHHG